MKRFKALFGGLMTALLLSSCVGATAFPFPPKSTAPQTPVSAQSVSLTPVSLGLSVGETSTLVAAVSPADTTDKKVTWTSDNAAVATVNASGLVAGVAVGSTLVTATDSAGHQMTAPVTVATVKVVPTSVTLSAATLALKTGETGSLTAVVLPAGTTDKTVVWSSATPAVATVSASGLVTAVAAGTSVVTAADAAGHKATALVTVTVAAQSVSVVPTSLGVTVGTTSALTATVLPANTSDKTVTWSTSSAAVATVSSAGVVTAVAVGSAVITATDSAGQTFDVPVTVAAAIVKAASISVSPTTLSLLNGATGPLTATVLPANTTDKTVVWSSATPAVATVSTTGVVTGVSAGSSVITATDSAGHKATSTVTITPIPAASISLDVSALTVYVGKTGLLTATVLPANAANKTVTWSSSSTSVATVSGIGVVTGVASGTSIVTATDSAGHKATATVTVSRIAPTSVTLAPATVTLTAGATSTLVPTVLPTDATLKTVTWSTSNAAIATVSSAGVVTAVAVGSATITATATDATTVKGTATVTVQAVAATGISLSPTSLSLALGGTGSFTATVTPTNASNKTVTWTSSNTAVATVSAGTIATVAVGSSTITATDSAGHSATAVVWVVPVDSTQNARNLMGINLSWNSTSDYSQDRLFADAVKSSRGWYRISDNSAIPAAELDSNFWPLTDAQLLLMAGLDKHDGKYTGTFDGVGTVSSGTYGTTGLSGLTQSYSSSTGKTSFSFTITGGGTAAIELKFSGTSGGIRNLSIMRPSTNGSSTSFPAGQVFTDQVLSFLSNFQAIRFMDYSWVNGSRIVNWADRAKLTDAVWSSVYRNTTYSGTKYSDGAPWEVAIDLCNAAGTDMWLNVPLFASDDYVSNLAALVKSRLNASLNVYVEYCNEIWNTAGAFPQGNWNHELAIADVAASVQPALNYDGNTNDWYWAWRRVGRRIVEISNLFRKVWGDTDMPAPGKAAPRVRPILASQLGYDEVVKQPVSLIANKYPQPLAYYLYGIGGSAYWNSSDTSSVSAYFSAPTVANTAAGFKSQGALALGFGLKRIAYEGGPSMDSSTTAINQVYTSVWSDSRLRTLLVDVHNQAWSATGGDLLMYYAATGDYQWGFATTLFDSASPKLLGIQDLKAPSRAAATAWKLVPGTLDGISDAAFSFISGNSYSTSEGLNVTAGSSGQSYLVYPFRTGADGNYTVQVTGRSGAGVHVTVDGVDLATIPARGTSGTVTAGTVNLAAGAHAVRLWTAASTSMVIGSVTVTSP